MSDGTPTLTMGEALDAARAELGEATPDAAEAAMPADDAQAPNVSEQATPVEGEQPAADEDSFSVDASGLEDALLDASVDSQNGSGPGIVPGSDDFWNLALDVQTVDGQETVTVRELHDGYLRQKDYTQKTQMLAEQRKNAEKAVEFLAAFEQDPASFIRSLAVQAGLIGEDQKPVKEVEIAKIPSPDDLEQMISSRVEERVNADPRVQAAQVSDARAQVDAEFARLEGIFNVNLSTEVRDSLIMEAQRRQTSDLESLLAKRILTAQQKQSRAADGNLASTSRPGSPPAAATSPTGDQPTASPSMREAWQQAKVAAAQQ